MRSPCTCEGVAAENASSASLARAATQTTLPSAEVMTRTGLQPAVTLAMTERAGSDSAVATLMTASVPTALFWLWSSLVEYSQRPSGETASPTGATCVGIDSDVRAWTEPAGHRVLQVEYGDLVGLLQADERVAAVGRDCHLDGAARGGRRRERAKHGTLCCPARPPGRLSTMALAWPPATSRRRPSRLSTAPAVATCGSAIVRTSRGACPADSFSTAISPVGPTGLGQRGERPAAVGGDCHAERIGRGAQRRHRGGRGRQRRRRLRRGGAARRSATDIVDRACPARHRRAASTPCTDCAERDCRDQYRHAPSTHEGRR